MASKSNTGLQSTGTQATVTDHSEEEPDAFGMEAVGKGVKKFIRECVYGSDDYDEAMETADQNRNGLDDDKTEYDFTHSRRGRAVIIVNDVFKHFPGKRSGADKDKTKLCLCFQSLGFDVIPIENSPTSEMMRDLRQVAREMSDDRDFDCFVFAISSHGDNLIIQQDKQSTVTEDIVFATDGFVPTADILDIFSDENCPGLIGKPRLFFIQACRGNEVDPGYHPLDLRRQPDKTFDPKTTGTDIEVITRLPCRKDFLVMYATPPGHFAFRKTEEGSWFVLELCRILSLKTDGNLFKLLRWVIKAVVDNYTSNTLPKNPDLHLKKQTPCIHSMLIKDVFFRPK